jgi:hypothetical protein
MLRNILRGIRRRKALKTLIFETFKEKQIYNQKNLT